MPASVETVAAASRACRAPSSVNSGSKRREASVDSNQACFRVGVRFLIDFRVAGIKTSFQVMSMGVTHTRVISFIDSFAVSNKPHIRFIHK